MARHIDSMSRKNAHFSAVVLVILSVPSFGQQPKNSGGTASNPGTAALAYFDNVRGASFASYLKSIRPRQLSPELKSKLIAIFPKQDIVHPSGKALEKLAALDPVLEYYDRRSVVDLLVVRMGQPIVLFLAGVVVISEEALGLLSARELQAVVAHEMGHEYFWNEWQTARLNREYEKIQEIELLCDGMAIVALSQLGLEPQTFIVAITKITRAHDGPRINMEYYTSLEERIKFCNTMLDMVRARSEVFGPLVDNR